MNKSSVGEDSFYYVVGFGSNLGDREDYIQRALIRIENHPLNTVLKASKILTSLPVGQQATELFLNGALLVKSDHKPEVFLKHLLSIEESLGRVRTVKWGNRTIDLDILRAFDSSLNEIHVTSTTLTVPHPHLNVRPFALEPCNEVLSYLPTKNGQDFKNIRQALLDVFGFPSQTFYLWMFGFLLLRLFFATMIPFGNDEAYYWDWGRELKLSFFDHPPLVSWISAFGQLIFGSFDTTLSGRFLVPIMHFLSHLFLFDLFRRLNGGTLRSSQITSFVLITQLATGFSLGGFFLMPDGPLMLFSTIALWLSCVLLQERQITWRHGVLLGICWGLAGLSKYHAAILAVGPLIYLLVNTTKRFGKSVTPFWLFVIGFGLLTTMPVWVWNYQHDWISIRFQASRGLSTSEFDWKWPVRFALGACLMVGPVVLGVFSSQKREVSITLQRMLLVTAFPLLAILLLFSFSSQLLPHWALPGAWFLLPMLIVAFDIHRAPWRKNLVLGYGVLTCLVVPLALSFASSRDGLLSAFNQQSRGLGELTLWETASRDNEFIETLNSYSISESKNESCPKHITVVSGRWFTVAQLAATLPDRPKVRSLALDKPYYYLDRDHQDPLPIGCGFIALAEEDHAQDLLKHPSLGFQETRILVIKGHLDRPVFVGRGILTQASQKI
jgi:2-amino-4-hydroxy-6-hydroxymethyldihydropteridine diphosphokinase